MSAELELLGREMHIAVCCWDSTPTEKRAGWLEHFATELEQTPGATRALLDLAVSLRRAAWDLRLGSPESADLLLIHLDGLAGQWNHKGAA